MNNTVLIGRLTRDLELRFIPNSGTAVARFSLAVNRDFKKEGQPDADFFNIVVWGKTAEACSNYLKKGRLCAVRGQLRNNNYEDKNGTKHFNVEINADQVEFLEWGDKETPKKQEPNNEFNQFQAVDGDDDIPF